MSQPTSSTAGYTPAPAGAGSKTAEVITRAGPAPLTMKLASWLVSVGVLTKDRFGKIRLPVLKDGRYLLRYRHATKGTAEWMAAVERDATIGWRGREQMDGPLWVEIDCFEARPVGHFRADGSLRPDAPAHPDRTVTHDSGKMRRAVEDALTNAEVWSDDKRIVDGGDRKHYCDREAVVLEPEGEDDRWREPRAVIRIGRMAHATVEEAGITSPPAAGQEQLLAA